METVLRVTVMVFAMLPLSAQSDETADLDESFKRDVLLIETADSGCFRFDVYLAESRKQQQRGLMFVRELPTWSGMIFIYPQPDMLSMWMKNTYISLDILFARADGSVSSVAENTEPLSLKSISAIEPVRYVLELNAGTASRLGIGAGSKLIFDRPE